MNKYIFSGTLGKDAEVKDHDGGFTTISFSVAVSERYTDKSGNKQQKVTWVKCTKFTKTGNSTKIADYLKRGMKVLIEGKPKASAYMKDGNPTGNLEVSVDEIELLGSRGEQGSNDSHDSGSYPEPSGSDDSLDLPF